MKLRKLFPILSTACLAATVMPLASCNNEQKEEKWLNFELKGEGAIADHNKVERNEQETIRIFALPGYNLVEVDEVKVGGQDVGYQVLIDENKKEIDVTIEKNIINDVLSINVIAVKEETPFEPITLNYDWNYNVEDGKTEIPEPETSEQMEKVDFPTDVDAGWAYFNDLAKNPGILIEDLIHEFYVYLNERIATEDYEAITGRMNITINSFELVTEDLTKMPKAKVSLSIYHKYFSRTTGGSGYNYTHYLDISDIEMTLLVQNAGNVKHYFVGFNDVEPDEISTSVLRDTTLENLQGEHQELHPDWKDWNLNWLFFDGEDFGGLKNWYYENANSEFANYSEGSYWEATPDAADCLATWTQYGRCPYHLGENNPDWE